MKNIWEEEPVVCFTSDMIGASEDMIQKTFELLDLKSLKLQFLILIKVVNLKRS